MKYIITWNFEFLSIRWKKWHRVLASNLYVLSRGHSDPKIKYFLFEVIFSVNRIFRSCFVVTSCAKVRLQVEFIYILYFK